MGILHDSQGLHILVQWRQERTKPKPRASNVSDVHSANTSGRVPAKLTTQTTVFTQFLIASTLNMGKKTGCEVLDKFNVLLEVREMSGQRALQKRIVRLRFTQILDASSETVRGSRNSRLVKVENKPSLLQQFKQQRKLFSSLLSDNDIVNVGPVEYLEGLGGTSSY